LKTVSRLSPKGIHFNVTLCFSLGQAVLAAKAGARFISPFIGRLDDLSHRGMELIPEIVQVYETYGFDTEVLAASIRSPLHVTDAALSGAHIATIPYKVYKQLFKHPLTDIGLAKFLDDHRKAQG
jgi:transaldolase